MLELRNGEGAALKEHDIVSEGELISNDLCPEWIKNEHDKMEKDREKFDDFMNKRFMVTK